MGRTLYLTETDKFRALADGPSIWIAWDNKAGQRIPIRLISRCVIVGNIQLETSLISLFAAHNIPVVFTNLAGEELAIALPYNHRLPRHWREQKVFIESKRNRERFIQWAKIKRMTLQLLILKRLFSKRMNQPNRDIGEGDYLQIIASLQPKESEKWKITKSFIENLFRTLIVEQLNQAGLNLNLSVIHRFHNFGLVLDFIYVLEPLIDEQAIQFFKNYRNHLCFHRNGISFALNKEGIKNIINRFENKKEEIENIIVNTIDELFHLMRELS